MLVAAAACVQTGRAKTCNPKVITDLLDRIGGTGAHEKFVVVVDESLATTDGKDVFVVTSDEEKPCIMGSSIIAVTTGINWYLNHTMHINLTWNCPTTNLTSIELIAPTVEEKHKCDVDYRYYLNYCTYSYSCAMWTEERWMQEVDWMALHGVNLPLMLIGLDVIWHDIYTSEEFNYTTEEIGKYIAGPAFQAWWGMANLEGHGGPNPAWWYERQRSLCKAILERMRAFGMEPVLPGFYGLVPSNLATKMSGTDGYTSVVTGGKWQGYQAPGMLNASDAKFAHLAELFYEKQKEIMGTGKYFSMDLCHEGGTAPTDRAAQVKGIMQALDRNVGTESVWLAQAWGGTPIQEIRDNVAKGRLLILDLYGETQPGTYGEHDFVYCMLLNFGGRTGLHGRFDNLVKHYNASRGKATLRGVGATPEGIENNPVMYDALFELPWTTVEKEQWTKNYATARYGKENAVAQAAMQKLMNSVYNCPGGQQGTSETVVLAQPSLTVGSVSSWSTSAIPYDYRQVIAAADDMLSQTDALEGNNFEYDLLDITRQALSDYAYHLLAQVNADYQQSGGTGAAFLQRKDQYLTLIDDLDELLGSHRSYRFGNWAEMARAIADEPAAKGAGKVGADWLELDNLRRQVSTWSDFASSLREYSNREWNGLLRDYYKPRWVEFFAALENGEGTGRFNEAYWFEKANEWIKNEAHITYSATPEGDTKQLAAEKFARYFFPISSTKGGKVYMLRHIAQELSAADFIDTAHRGKAYTFAIPEGTTATLGIDMDNNGDITADETVEGNTITIPANAVTSDVKARLTLDDGTTVVYRLALMDEITEARTVSVRVAEGCEEKGSVCILNEPEGTQSVTNTDAVRMQAKPAEGYEFEGWTQTILSSTPDGGNSTPEDGSTTSDVGTENPISYYGAQDAVFTASFVESKWGIPEETATKDIGDIRRVASYLSSITCTQDGNTAELYSTTECPERLFNIVPVNISAARGSGFTLNMNDAGGMSYCYLSAYIDLNQDGDFDDAGELLEVRGTKNQQTANICAAPLQVILPYDMPTGITHLRLRFDSAWAGVVPPTGSATGANVPAKEGLTRMTYEIPINISEYATKPTHVVIKSNNESMGTVRNIAGTTGNEINVPVGTKIKPEVESIAEGCEFVHWTDHYGRIISTEESFEIIPAENSTFTAIFRRNTKLQYGDWEFGFEENGQDVFITDVVTEGSSVLDLSGKNNVGKTLSGIQSGVFRGSGLERLVLPSGYIALDNYLNTNFKGAGIENATIVPAEPIPSSKPWKLALTVTNNGNTYNEWGSGLLATGYDALAKTYPGGFQFYLAKAGTITMKINGSDEQRFSTPMGSRFGIEMDCDGEGNFSITLIPESGQPETKTFGNVALNNINVLCTALPEGVDIEHLLVADPTLRNAPFAGCENLTAIDVPAGSTAFSSKYGVLLSADGKTLRAYPEGRYTTRAYVLQNAADGCYVAANPPGKADGSFEATGSNGPERRVATEAALRPTALLRQAKGEGKTLLYHLNSAGYFGGRSNTGGRGQQIEVLTNSQWAGDYTISPLREMDATLSADVALQVENFYLSSDNGKFVLDDATPDANDATRWTLREINELPVAVSDARWTALCLPVAAIVPPADEATVYAAARVENDAMVLERVAAGTVLAAGEGILVETSAARTVNFALSFDTEGTPLSGNLLDGATIERTGLTAETFYGLGYIDNIVGFYISNGTIVPANKAYLKAEKLNGVKLSHLRFASDISTGIDGASAGNGGATATWYDLRGRRVLYPSTGIYVNGKGEKVFIK